MGRLFTGLMIAGLLIGMIGSALAGSVVGASTRLTAAITAASDTIPVGSTNGFESTGVIVIGSEHVAYASKTPTSFTGTVVISPLVRGADDTTAVLHATGEVVRTRQGAQFNSAASYNVVVITDSSGDWAAISTPLAVLRLIGSVTVPPISFIPPDVRNVATLIFGALVVGLLLAAGIALAGSRRI